MLIILKRLEGWDIKLRKKITKQFKYQGIFISLQKSEKETALVIENTGAAIPENDLPHLFTPFYRTDKSRSKATGGSGLGLYLVKTILDLHGMTYCIKNTEQGVVFFLSLNGQRLS